MTIKKAVLIGTIIALIGAILFFLRDDERVDDIERELNPSPPATNEW